LVATCINNPPFLCGKEGDVSITHLVLRCRFLIFATNAGRIDNRTKLSYSPPVDGSWIPIKQGGDTTWVSVYGAPIIKVVSGRFYRCLCVGRGDGYNLVVS
jgi:hypothetical protein